jgi:hypothetical protein
MSASAFRFARVLIPHGHQGDDAARGRVDAHHLQSQDCAIPSDASWWNLCYRLTPKVHGHRLTTELCVAAIDGRAGSPTAVRFIYSDRPLNYARRKAETMGCARSLNAQRSRHVIADSAT